MFDQRSGPKAAPSLKTNPFYLQNNRQRRGSVREFIGYRFFFMFIAAFIVCFSFSMPKLWGRQLEYDFKLPGTDAPYTRNGSHAGELYAVESPAGELYAVGSTAVESPAVESLAVELENPFGYGEILNVDMGVLKYAITDGAYHFNGLAAPAAAADLRSGATNEIALVHYPDNPAADINAGNDLVNPAADIEAGNGLVNPAVDIEAGSSFNFPAAVAGAGETDAYETGGIFYDYTVAANGGAGYVILDAGHGGSDPGSVEAGVYEKDIDLDVTLKTAALLDEAGVDYILTRTGDEYVPNGRRIGYADPEIAAFYVSVHCDWYKQKVINGTSALYNEGDGDAKNLAVTLLSYMTEDLGTEDRGVHPYKNIITLREARTPAVIIELAFMSNKYDFSLLVTDEFKERAAHNLAEGICSAVGALRRD